MKENFEFLFSTKTWLHMPYKLRQEFIDVTRNASNTCNTSKKISFENIFVSNLFFAFSHFNQNHFQYVRCHNKSFPICFVEYFFTAPAKVILANNHHYLHLNGKNFSTPSNFSRWIENAFLLMSSTTSECIILT